MKYAYWISNIKGISKGKIRFLLKQGYCAKELYEASEKELSCIQELTLEEQTYIIESKKCKATSFAFFFIEFYLGLTIVYSIF